MKRNLIVVSCLMLVGITGYFSLSNGAEPLRYDPVVYEDGSVEYRLIDFNAGSEGQTDDDKHWILKFPKNLFVDIPINKNGKLVENQELYLNFTLPSFTSVTLREAVNRKEVLRIYLNANERLYGKGFYQKYDISFSSIYDAKYNLECRKNKEIIPGIFSLRDPSKKEIEAMRERYGKDAWRYEVGCKSKSFPSITNYAVYDSKNRLQGGGSCHPKGVGGCSFDFWLPQNRMVNYSFMPEYLLEIHKIHATIVDIITKATVR